MQDEMITLRRLGSPVTPHRWSFAIDGPDWLDHLNEREVWFECEDGIAPATDLLDSALAATLMLAMTNGLDISVDGPISRRLYYNAQEFQLAWTAWRPDLFTLVRIEATDIVDLPPEGRNGARAIQAFSGGLDGIFTLATHTRLRPAGERRPLDRAVLVHGFDIPLGDKAAFDAAASKARLITEDAGVTLSLLSTNLRVAIPVNWEMYFGAAVASILLQYASVYSEGLVGSSEPFSGLVLPWGSNPITDPLLSGALDIVHDGAGFTRVEKTKAIADWSVAADNMRVCWRSPDKSRNCCKCEKCVRTALTFRAWGLPVPRCFEEEVRAAEIVAIEISNDPQFLELKQVLTLADRNLIRGEWVEALRARLMKYRRDTVGTFGRPVRQHRRGGAEDRFGG